MSSMA